MATPPDFSTVLPVAHRNRLDALADYTDSVASRLKGETVTITVGSGGDHATIGDALEAASRYRPLFDKGAISQVEVSLLSGFTMSEQVIVTGIDLGWVTITSVDATVTIDRSALTTATGSESIPAFAGIDGATLPLIDALFDMDSSGTATHRTGFHLKSSRVVFNNGAGCINAAHRGLDIHDNSLAMARSTNFSGAGNIGARIGNASVAQLRNATITGCGSANVSVGTGSAAYVVGADLSGSLGTGMSVGGSVGANEADVSGAATHGLSVNGFVNFNGGDASGCGSNAIDCTGGKVLANAADLTSAGGDAVSVSNGGIVNATGTTGTRSQEANVVTGDGAILDTAEPQGHRLASTPVAVSCLAMEATTGTVPVGVRGTGTNPFVVRLMGDGSDTVIGGDAPPLPDEWETFDVLLRWVNTSAETGDVELRLIHEFMGAGDTFTDGTVAGSFVVDTAGNEDQVVETTLGSGLTNSPGDGIRISVRRRTSVAGNLAADIGAWQLVFRRAS